MNVRDLQLAQSWLRMARNCLRTADEMCAIGDEERQRLFTQLAIEALVIADQKHERAKAS